MAAEVGEFFNITSAIIYWNLYSAAFPFLSRTDTIASRVPNGVLLATTESENITSLPLVRFVRGTSLSPCLLNQTPFGTFLITKLSTVPELSLTVKVGLNVAPRKTKNLLSAAFIVNLRTVPSPVFIDTVGACLSGFFAVS